MARKQRRTRENVPFDDAIKWCGHPALRAVSSAQMFSNWKTRGVPWDVVGAILLTRFETEAQSLRLTGTTAPLQQREADDVGDKVRIAQAQVARVFFKNEPETWRTLLRILEGFVSAAEITEMQKRTPTAASAYEKPKRVRRTQ